MYLKHMKYMLYKFEFNSPTGLLRKVTGRSEDLVLVSDLRTLRPFCGFKNLISCDSLTR